MIAAPERISTPFESGCDAVTRSSRTKADFCCAPAVTVGCDIAAENRIAKTANKELFALVTQHLMGASLIVASKDNCSEQDLRTSLLVV
jgi:hypothetical protein